MKRKIRANDLNQIDDFVRHRENIYYLNGPRAGKEINSYWLPTFQVDGDKFNLLQIRRQRLGIYSEIGRIHSVNGRWQFAWSDDVYANYF